MLTISRLEGLDCAKDRVRLGPMDGVFAGDDRSLGHDVECTANSNSKAKLEASIAEGLADTGGYRNSRVM